MAEGCLYVSVNAQKVELPRMGGFQTYAIHVSIELLQNVQLKRDPKISFKAATWECAEITNLGTYNPERAQSSAREIVSDNVKKFMNAYLTENPKR